MLVNFAVIAVPLPGSIPPDINKLHIQRGTTFDEKLLSPELTWNGTVIGSKQFNDSSSSQSSKRPFQATIIKKNHHAEIPLSTIGKNALFNILKEKQKSKYTGTRMDKYSRVPDVKSRTALLDGKGDIMVGSPGRCSPHCRRIVAPVMNGAS